MAQFTNRGMTKKIIQNLHGSVHEPRNDQKMMKNLHGAVYQPRNDQKNNEKFAWLSLQTEE